MDKTGEGEEVRLADLPETKELALQGFGHDLFQEVRWLKTEWYSLTMVCLRSWIVTSRAEGRAGLPLPLGSERR